MTGQPDKHSEEDAPISFEWASDHQKKLVESMPGSPLLAMGGFNSGKTSGAILHMLALCDNFPGYKVAILRKTFKDLTMTTRPSFDQWIDPKRVKQASATEVTLDNGSSFIFHHLDSPNSATILKGLEINGAILDQAEQMQERTFTVLLGRLGRWKGAKVPRWVIDAHEGPWPWKNRNGQPVPPISVLLTANPTEDGDPELHWVWQRFSPESKSWQEKWRQQGYRQIIMPTTENKFAGEQNVEILLQQDEDYVRRFVRGEWVRSKGHIFRIDDSSILDYSPELISMIENTTVLGRALDHGDSAPTACLLYGIDQHHNIFVMKEYYQPGTSDDGKEFNVADHRNAITALSKNLTIRTNLADPSIFNKTRNITGYATKQQRWSVASEYGDTRLISASTRIHWTPADNNEALSRQRLSQRLRLHPEHKHPISGESPAPYIYFVKKSDEWPHGVEHAISEIRNAKRVQVAENDGKPIYSDDRDPSIPDHSLDCLAPETRILTNDLRWVPIGTVKVGDVIIGFQEVAGAQYHGRRWERSTVLRTERAVKPCYRLVFEDGTTVVCSDDHQWLVRIAGTTNSDWQKTEDLDGISHRSPGRARSRPSGVNRVIKVMDVWGTDESRDAAYLAGALDGEGCVSKSSLTFSQKKNEMLEKVCLILDEKGIKHAKSACGRERDVMSVRIQGGFRSVLKVLGEIRPVRLIPRIKIDRRLEGTPLRIIKREFIGDTEVVALETSTHTFFAEGLASHNCVRYVVNSATMPASPPVDSRKLAADAKPDGRVLITIPKIDDPKPSYRKETERRWKSRGGGYAVFFALLIPTLVALI